MPLVPLERQGPSPLIIPIIFLAGILLGFVVAYEPKRPHTPAPDLSPVVLELEKIRETIAQLQVSKCMTVNTPVLQMSVYSTPNLGVKPVPPKPTYDKSVEKGN